MGVYRLRGCGFWFAFAFSIVLFCSNFVLFFGYTKGMNDWQKVLTYILMIVYVAFCAKAICEPV